MKTLSFVVVLLCAAWPAGAQTVTLRATVQSQSAQHIVLRLHSGEIVQVPRADVVTSPSSVPKPVGTMGPTTRPFPLYDVSTQCVTDWPSDDFMQAACKRGQQEAFDVLAARSMAGNEHEAIRNHCINQWRTNYRLRNFCEEEALRALEWKSRSTETSRPDGR